jgi:hypothetical protein
MKIDRGVQAFPTTFGAAVSKPGTARLVFDGSDLLLSENGGAYAPISSGGGLVVAGVLAPVADAAAATATDVSVLNNGSTIFVETFSAFFEVQDSTLTVDGVTVLATNSPTRRWLRRYAPSERWLKQPTWWIDPVAGDDENDGSTLGTALLTLDELARRWADGELPQTTTVNIAPGTVTSPNFEVTFRVKFTDFVRLWFVGQRTVLFSGTIDSYAAYTNTTPGAITDAAVGSFAPYVKTALVVGTSGPINNSAAWILDDPAATVAEVTKFVDINGNISEPTAIGGDTYQIVALPFIEPTLIFDGSNTGPQSTAVALRDLELDGLRYGAVAGAAASDLTDQPTLWLYWCLHTWRLQLSTSSVRIQGNLFDYDVWIRGAYCELWCCGMDGWTYWNDGAARTMIRRDSTFRNSDVIVAGGSFHFADGWLFIYDWPAQPIVIHSEGQLVFNPSPPAPRLLGSATTGGSVVNMGAGSRMYFPSGSSLSVVAVATGSGTDIYTNGGTRSYASIPAGGYEKANEDLYIAPSAFYALALWPLP